MNESATDTQHQTAEKATPERNADAPRGWRYVLGFWMFTIPFAMILGSPIVVPLLVPDAGQATAIVGAVVVIGEVVWFASIPLLGKAGFKELKGKAFGIFALTQGPISEARHRWGVRFLGLFALLNAVSMISLLGTYFYLGEDNLMEGLFGLNFKQEARLYVGAIVASGFSLVIGVYMLGQPFVARLAASFSWQPDGSASDDDETP